MSKKNNQWNLADMQATLVKDTEQRIERGFADIAEGRTADAVAPAPAQAAPSQSVRTPAAWHKEPVRDILVHCPTSLHARLIERKQYRREELGLRETINDYVVQAVALWLETEGTAETAQTQPVPR